MYVHTGISKKIKQDPAADPGPADELPRSLPEGAWEGLAGRPISCGAAQLVTRMAAFGRAPRPLTEARLGSHTLCRRAQGLLLKRGADLKALSVLSQSPQGRGSGRHPEMQIGTAAALQALGDHGGSGQQRGAHGWL